MYAESGAEAVVVEIVVVGGPSAEGGVGQIEAELELGPSEAEHQLGLEDEGGRVVSDYKGLGAVAGHLVFVELGCHQAALDAEAEVDAVVVEACPAEIDLAENEVVVSFGAVGVVDKIGDGVLTC